MKRFSILLLCFFICYIIYYDVKVGTLPVMNKTAIASSVPNHNIEERQATYYEHFVKQGDTVLTITEKYHGTLPISIDQLVKDFEKLNPGIKVEEIQVGTSYFFPDYK
ncbi:LysM peptidoglycan-binding domain-containing protein [Metabacillus halosaccharovorans]|uniref:LysM peptidoglycan-binding domain-containing protein n=1 Tax=Metabacillus halosaccharovorans TaxID=930124 RepID=UPI001C1FA2CE|nr:LysM peptidoglycan-binding domain-containing protein [Metabacillus halosaccharovorans]